MTHSASRRFSCSALALTLACAAAFAHQDQKPADPPAAPEQPASDAPRKPDPVPDLDELLGLPSQQRPRDDAESQDADAPPATDLDAQALERKLSAQEMNDKFKLAIAEMGQLADRLERSRDTGLETQRLHEQVILKLDALIKSSKNSNSSSSSSGSSSSSSASQAPNQPKPGQSESSNEAGQGENTGEVNPPAFQSAELRGRLDVARAAWGALPERVRQSLLQGSSDHFSSLYEALTEEYYRRLAEEAKQ